MPGGEVSDGRQSLAAVPPWRFPAPLIRARLIRREKRFLAEVEMEAGERVWVHVPNSGAMTGCLIPGMEVLLTREPGETRRTAYTWRFGRVPQGWVCVDTLVPNRLVAGALAGPGLPGLPRPGRVQSEVRLEGGSRLDFVAETAKGQIFIEVKSISWVEAGVALFPDGVTTRGRRHLEVLTTLVEQGHQSWQIFVVQRPDAQIMEPAAAVDPAYARELAAAWYRGVRILVLGARVEPPAVYLEKVLPVKVA